MSGIEIEVLKEFDNLLSSDGVPSVVIKSIVNELSSEIPNAERLVEAIKAKEVTTK